MPHTISRDSISRRYTGRYTEKHKFCNCKTGHNLLRLDTKVAFIFTLASGAPDVFVVAACFIEHLGGIVGRMVHNTVLSPKPAALM